MKSSIFPSECKDDSEFVLGCLEKTGIIDLKDRLITELSGGQLQRVFLARVFAQDPEIVLLDEPTNHLDLRYQIELVEYLKEWSKVNNRCVIGVLHDINLALSFADRILLINNGKISAHEYISSFDLGLINDTYQADVSSYMLDSLKRWER
jgi:iron complex transport system ATP-binding protein